MRTRLHLNRVKLQIPQITGQNTLEYWAFPVGLRASNNAGIQIIPSVNEVVWVSFEFGNPRRPIWQFGHRAEPDYLPDELKDHRKIWFRTPSGHRIIFDDNNNGGITIESSQGRIVNY